MTFAKKNCQISNNPCADPVATMSTTIHAMNIFVRAVETNNFTGVARSLFIDPGAVSRTIKALEAELGVLLFSRSTRSLKLTPEGARFYRDCVPILKRFENATGQFRCEGSQRGRLKIGLAPGMSRRMLLREIPAFAQQYPEIEIVLVNVDELAEIGEKGVDVLLRGTSLRKRGGTDPDPQGVVVHKLIQSSIIACASPKYLDRAGAPRVPAGLAGYGIIRPVLPDWECAGMARRVAIYRKTQPMPQQIRLFVRHLTEAFRRYNVR